VIVPRPAEPPSQPAVRRTNPGRVRTAEMRLRAVNDRAAGTVVRSPGGTTGLIRWYL